MEAVLLDGPNKPFRVSIQIGRLRRKSYRLGAGLAQHDPFSEDTTATLKATWRTAEWTNPLVDETVLTAVGGDPTFGPLTLTGPATRLPDGQFERVYTTTIPCRPNAKYRMDVSARVGGVTETDFDMAKASRYCIGS